MNLPRVPSDDHWSHLTYRLTTLAMQQRVLKALRDVSLPGVVALGTCVDDEFRIVVESPTRDVQCQSKRLIYIVDPGASCLTRTSEPEFRTWSGGL